MCYNKLVTVERGQVKNWDDKILGFDLVFIGQNKTDFNFILVHIGCFKKVNFQGFNLVV